MIPVKNQSLQNNPQFEALLDNRALELAKATSYRFSFKALVILILGGVFEFVGCQILVVSYNFGSRAHLNDGITSSLILFSSVFILVLSYAIYRETINMLQSTGLFVILSGVFVISLFKAPELSLSDPIETTSEEQGFSSQLA